MAALPKPEAGELIEVLRGFVNVDDDADFMLLLGWLVAALCPFGPYPILVITGEQGAAKSALARICRLLGDPNVAPIRSLPRSEHDLIVSASNSWVLAYDNVSASRADAWLSDSLCRLSTGGGFGTRQLHTDKEEMLFAGQRPIVLNGIGDIAGRPDLTDRSICLTLPAIREEQRRAESEFWSKFELHRPAIFGALLDALVTGLRRLPEIRLASAPRMADFATIVEACAPGFGWGPGEFLAVYTENREAAVAAAAEASPLVPLIEGLLALGGYGDEGFDGSATALLSALRQQSSEKTQEQRWFPKLPAQMGTQLRRIAPLLKKSSNINVEYYKAGRGRDRGIRLYCASATVLQELRASYYGAKPDDSGTPD